MVDCKEAEHLEELDMEDSRDLMQPETSKWTRIASKVNAMGNGVCHRDGAACKYKWQMLLSDYKKIADFHSGTGMNEEEYWGLTFADKKSVGLPRTFFEEVYGRMHSWLRHQATMNPPHVQDLLNVHDMNHVDPMSQHATDAAETNGDLGGDTDMQEKDLNSSQGSEPAPENFYDVSSDSDGIRWGSGPWTHGGVVVPALAVGSPTSPISRMEGMDLNFAPQGGSPLSQMRSTSHSPIGGPPDLPRGSPATSTLPGRLGASAAPVRASGCPGITTAVPRVSRLTSPPRSRLSTIHISSSTAGGMDGQRSDGSTGVRRKNSTAHQVLANVNAENGERLVQSLANINDTNRELERN
jgi:hypothetical protein